MGAVKSYLSTYKTLDNLDGIQLADLNKKNIALLNGAARSAKAPAKFIEVMACEGGCVTGPCSQKDVSSSKRLLTQELSKRKGYEGCMR